VETYHPAANWPKQTLAVFSQDTYLHALFPAIFKNQITVGSDNAIAKNSNLDLAFSYAAKETATSGVTGIATSHEQYNGRLVYSTHY